ncbi:MAG TPA: amidohydrolase [Clostridiaceae bacterium]|nr:amidohydrolase [Clostridiaceae bacterium]
MKKTPSSIFYNGFIYTLNDKNDIYGAMAVQDGKIVALGTDDEILALKGQNTEVYDLKKHVVIPGLIDTHAHIFRVGLSELREEKFIPTSITELLNYIKEKVKLIKPGEWLYFPNTYPTRLKEYRFPTLEELDSAAPNNPVYVDGAYAGQANSYLLRLLNIDENSPDPENGKFIRDPQTGKLTGLLFRCGNIVKKVMVQDNYNIEDIKNGFLNIQSKYNELGITSVIDPMTNENDIRALNELYEEGKLSLRTVLTGLVTSTDSATDYLEKLKSLVETPAEWGKLSFCKVMIDGGILTGTSYMRKPYNDTLGVFGIKFEGFRGIVQYDAFQLKDFINIAYDTGLQMTAHCIGDAAVDLFLDAYEAFNKENDITEKRYSIIHCDFSDDQTLKRIKKLNLSILFQPMWHYMDGDILNKVLDSNTMNTFLPYRKYVEIDIHAASGSDHMIKYDSLRSQNPYNPFHALYNMVTRKTRFGNVIGGEYCISRYDAIKMYTGKASYVSFDENIKGTLEVGKVADFAVLSQDYFNCPEEEIKNIFSVMTVVGGKVVHSKV